MQLTKSKSRAFLAAGGVQLDDGVTPQTLDVDREQRLMHSFRSFHQRNFC